MYLKLGLFKYKKTKWSYNTKHPEIHLKTLYKVECFKGV